MVGNGNVGIAVPYEMPNHFQMATVNCQVERCLSLMVGKVDIGSVSCQVLNSIRVTLPNGEVERRISIIVGNGDKGPMLLLIHQVLNHIQIAFLTCRVEGCVSSPGCGVGSGSLLHQKPHHIQMVVLAGKMERRPLIVIVLLTIHIGTLLHQVLDNIHVAMFSCSVEWCTSITGSKVNIDVVFFQQVLHDIQVAFPACLVNCRRSKIVSDFFPFRMLCENRHDLIQIAMESSVE
mmetsp:Transcript_8264/g.17642  ORF Transcript_8264/g.17642 Transcript_8264/m.17642 type:complete len:234 (-) Transcript_8264:191-892(-)